MSIHQRGLAEPAFPDDDGLIDSRLAEALGDDARVFAVYGEVRVFVPIVAVLGERATDGTDKSADMAAVFMTGADGRKALVTFSSVEALEAWNPVARPVPVWGREAAQAALDEGASALLLDLGAEHFTALELQA
ncbi:MAG TPA: SseB family protein [Aeromicrobium sp.]|nr:SseB family protein [Aeromicrobium sp.]